MANAAVDELLSGLGPDRVKVGDQIPRRNWSDESGLEPTSPLALVLPRTTEDVSAALKICHGHGQAVVTQGGMTGLAGGAHPGEGEVALAFTEAILENLGATPEQIQRERARVHAELA